MCKCVCQELHRDLTEVLPMSRSLCFCQACESGRVGQLVQSPSGKCAEIRRNQRADRRCATLENTVSSEIGKAELRSRRRS